ncbi:MAG: 50S ribosomal protein L15 [Myxococcota bacterium]|nr:50S ribosomal protein L15 [Myxococcota bacterium]
MSDILSRLKPPEGSRKRIKRVGRGPGSGLGKTCGRGQKGQKSRSGAGVGRGFEGGQMPAQRRMPKRGFTNPFRKVFTIVNLSKLESFEDGAVVDPEALFLKGIIRTTKNDIKVLGKGALTKKLTIRAHAVSTGALAKIEEAGSTFEKI